jgi:IS5 family transposase
MGWFFGYKPHLGKNKKGELLNFVITQGNTADREPQKNERFIAKIKDKLFEDKGYISARLSKLLFVNGIKLIVSFKKHKKRFNDYKRQKFYEEKDLLLKQLVMSLKILVK